MKSHAVAVEVSHQPPRDWFPRWATALGGLIAMAVVIGSLAGLNLWSGQQQAAFRSVITLRSAVAVEQESLFDPSGQPTARQAAAAVALAEVEAAGIPSVDRASIVHLSAVYQAAVKRELTILRGGNPPAAVALDATVGDPAFRALDLKLGHVIDATAYASERGATIALVMSIGVVVGAGAAVALFASFARRRQIRLFSAEANAGRLADIARFTAESEEGFRSLFDQNPQPMFVSKHERSAGGDDTWRFLSVNTSALELYGYSRDEFLSLQPLDLRVQGSEVALTAALRAVIEGRVRFATIQHRTKSGDVLDVELEIRETRFEGSSAKLVCTRDVTEKLRLQNELEHQAFYDGLTGLPNRSLFHDRLEHAHQRLRRGTSRYAVLVVDLDNFKKVNDSLGHGAGDMLLVEVAKRLADTMRPGDTTARLGGDEFAVLLEDLSDQQGAVTAANRLSDALGAPFSVGGRALSVSATIGIAFSTGTGTASDIVRNADVALYVGKARGKHCHELFSDDMHAAALERLTLEQDLREGIGRGELLLHYQPKVDARTGQLRGAEALVRWNHPTRGLVSPDAFISLAEQSGLISDVDDWVIHEACRQGRRWSTSSVGPIPVAVNVSGKDLVAAKLLTRVKSALADSALDPHLLELELTESATIPLDATTLRLLEEIRELGVTIAIDDFGTGYSVLSRLQDFPLDTLKIDLSFVRAIRAGHEEPIVDAMIAMGRGLGLTVVAEGVETEMQREYLTKKGCTQLQGYLFSRPVDATELVAWTERLDAQTLDNQHGAWPKAS